MELDATTRRPQLPKEEMERRKKNQLCYECGKPGHRAAFHRQGKTPSRKGSFPKKKLYATMQLNATTRIEDWEEDWVRVRKEDRGSPPFPTTGDKEHAEVTLKPFMDKALYDQITGNYASDDEEEFHNALTSSEERQLDDLVIKEEGVKARNKGVLRDFSVEAITKREDVTRPGHWMHRTMSYLAYDTNYCKYYREEKERRSYYPGKVDPIWINPDKYEEVDGQYRIRAVVQKAKTRNYTDT